MKEKTSATIEELKLLLEIWKALEDPKLRQPPLDRKTIDEGHQRIGQWIEHHLARLPPPA